MEAATQVYDKQPPEDMGNERVAVGKLFQAARKAKKLTIAQVADQTHIRQLYLTAIEEGDLDTLPGEIYKIGFLKTYSNFLELDGQEILRRLNLNQEVEVSYADNKYAIPTEQQQRPSRKFLYMSLAGALAFSVVLYVLNVADQNNIASISLPENLIQAKDELLEAKKQEAIIASDSKGQDLEKEVASGDENDEIALASSNTTGEQVAEKTTASVASAEDKKTVVDLTSSTEITLAAVKDTWVQVLDSSDKTIYVRLMHAGETYKLPAEGSFKLNTGNAGGLKINMNGQESKILGSDGEVIRGIELTETGLKPYF